MKKVLLTLLAMLVVQMQACSPDDDPGLWDAMDVGGDTAGPDWGLDTADETPADTAVETTDVQDDVDCMQDIDLVFVLDVSTSMSWVLSTLRDEIAEVWSYVETISDDADFDPHFGLVVFVDDVQVTNSGLPYASAADLQTEFENWRAFCSSNAQPGGSGCTNQDCPENTLDALAAAADEFSWREGALHVAILATDDTFKESPDRLCSPLSPSIPVNHTYTQAVVKLIENEIRVGTFAAHSSSACSIPADKEPGFFTPWGGQPPIPQQTGSEVWDLSQVQSGAISLTEAVQGFVLEEWCTDYLI